MPIGIPGTDSLSVASDALLNQAATFLGEPPQFWGRYFHSVASTDYQPTTESPFFRSKGIQVLPIARQTKKVDGSQATGAQDGQLNAEAILHCFPNLAGSVLVFLDVEGTPALSSDYFTGWAPALTQHGNTGSGGKVTLLPCVYALQSDASTWHAVLDAATKGVKCFGGWTARVHASACKHGPIMWNSVVAEPSIGLPFEVFSWQYAQDCGGTLDFNQTNPNLDGKSAFLQRLISP